VIDAARVERRTGWPVVSLGVVGSTNDEAARRARERPGERLAVVAERQTAGRGRGGAAFESPPGGLYVSLALRARSDEVPAPLVAAMGLAVAHAVGRAAGVGASLKWPNDVWVEGKKVAGILVEATVPARAPGADAPPDEMDVVAGVGVNVGSVPAALPDAVRRETTALDLHARRPVDRESLLCDLLLAVDGALADLRAPGGRARLEAAYRARAALLGRRVRFRSGAAEVSGVLVDVSLGDGLVVEERPGVRSLHPMAHARDLRPEAVPAATGPVIPS
jgi:BirA family biotin operon repressor/biotin-[acetyl-CoA-carboxylase] ligase